MKNLITLTAIALLAASSAYAADDKSDAKQGDMMKNCQGHMKDGKMMDSMPKDMMGKCQEMMKGGGMMQPKDAAKSDAPVSTGNGDQAKHH
jgi:hypothetical protein